MRKEGRVKVLPVLGRTLGICPAILHVSPCWASVRSTPHLDRGFSLAELLDMSNHKIVKSICLAK